LAWSAVASSSSFREAALKSKSRSDKLQAYRARRNFSRTSEPAPLIEPDEGSRFVVQKHDARRLHYDLRLEHKGVLLSWAVPQGPSLVVADKRLAVRTEDHPLKYLDFEGSIPKGEYGGGTMIVWDRGEWRPLHDPDKSLVKGHLEFVLGGERLHGRWHLVRMKPRRRETKEQWLLIKADDEYARSASAPKIVDEEVVSVLSGKSNDDLKSPDSIRRDHRQRAEIVAARRVRAPDAARLKGARKALLRLFVEPSLASSAQSPPNGGQWRHEIKFDGYRIQARVDGKEVRLLTRHGLDWRDRFAGVAEAVGGLGLGSAILDGEIVVEDSSGVSNFAELVNDLKHGRQDRFRYYIFDLLYLDGVDLTGASLADRKETLAAVLAAPPPSGRLALSEHFSVEGEKFFEHVSRLGLEGMISKRSVSPYRSGRTKDWLKSRCVLSQEFIVVGYVPSTTARRTVGSLALGYYEGDGLVLAGRVGSGFSQEEAKALFAALEQVATEASPLQRKPPAEAEIGVRWVAPRLIAQVDYHAWPDGGLIRHASFRGLRDDKEPREIVRERREPSPSTPLRRLPNLTHPERMLWPAEGVTKQGLADYYVDNAKWIMPHLVGRPLSLVRCPGGVAEDCFFAKHAWAGLSQSVRRVSIGKEAPALVIDDIEGLLALVQGNVLEIHPWGAALIEVERPDRLIFDLDPGEDVSWPAVIAAALEVRARLASDFGLESFVKTTGGKGLHVVVPLAPSIGWEPAKTLTKQVADAMAADSPNKFLSQMSKSARKGKIFVDYLRNTRGATAVAAYSTRARPGAAVSTPLGWDELSDAIKSDHYRLNNIERRLANLTSDPWVGFFKLRQKAAPRGRARPARASAQRAGGKRS
jgi:bifunctional non-homologous end joining protein LigD